MLDTTCADKANVQAWRVLAHEGAGWVLDVMLCMVG